jgi:hypothetical protein
MIYITGGRQNSRVRSVELYRCELAVLAAVDTETGVLTRLFEYCSPVSVKAEDNASVVFKSGHLDEKYFYLCTTTEVLLLDRHTLATVAYISHPHFNDLHHVRPAPDGSLIVTCTGLDSVFRMNCAGEMLAEWSTIGEDTWARFDKAQDYRKVLSTKPHKSHPNFCFFVGDDLYANRLQQRDCVCLTDGSQPSYPYKLAGGHDGIARNGRIYLTTVNGFVIVFDQRSREVVEKVDLNEIVRSEYALGWCRGVEILPDGRLIVGFSRLRPTKWAENVKWLKYRLSMSSEKPRLPTRLCCIDISRQRIEWELNLEDQGLNEIYSVIRSE